MRLRALASLVLPLSAAGCWHGRPPATLPSAVMAGKGAAAPAPAPAPGEVPPARSLESIASEVTAAMDRSADPCQDFYRYACGGWLDRTRMPADQTRWGRGFSVITERNRETLRQILEAPPRGGEGTPDWKLKTFYRSCMDEEAIERGHIRPLRALLAEIDQVEPGRPLMSLAGELQRGAVPVLLRTSVNADFKDPDRNILTLNQGGLGLPDRDYYLKDDEKSVAIRKDYVDHVTRMLALIGESQEAAGKDAAAVLAFETELARVSLPRAELRDPEKIYHKLDLDGLKKLTPGLDWDAFLARAGGSGLTDINVAVPGFLEGLQALVGKSELPTVRAYLRWQLVHHGADALNKSLVEEDFRFFGQRLRGQKELQPRWKRCVIATDEALGEILGQAFVERAFAGDSKAMAVGMIEGIEAAFAEGLPGLGWMDETTRGRATDKMKALGNKIGYPDVWRDYAKLEIRGGSHFENAAAGARFEFDRQLLRVGKPVDRLEWRMTPPTVNAYYNALFNEMVFPAGILQPPFYDRSFPMAMNFGGIGMVMGHELTHGFDDSGRKFDPKGRLSEWWEPQAADRFEKAAQCVNDLYSGYEVQPGVKLNGKLTLGENLADLGGIRESYRAYRAWTKTHGEEPRLVDGMNNEQLFFLAFAQTWCQLATPEEERVRVLTDTHSPAKFRVFGPLTNFPAFAETFGCAAGSRMRPPNPCEVW